MSRNIKWRREFTGRGLVSLCGMAIVILTLAISVFLLVRGLETFVTFGHSVSEFLFGMTWKPADDMAGGGKVGAALFIAGSIITSMVALLIAVPFSVATAIFITKISPELGRKVIRLAVEIFAGIPSVVYGWVGLVVLVPWIQELFHLPQGQSILAASIVLSVMIYPTITSISADAIESVNPKFLEGAYGLGATRWQVIYSVLIPAAKRGILTAIILGLSRAFGEALAVAMVIGKMKAFPTSLLAPAHCLTAAIASDMGGAMDGGELNAALWSMALFLFIMSFLFIVAIRLIGRKGQANA